MRILYFDCFAGASGDMILVPCWIWELMSEFLKGSLQD